MYSERSDWEGTIHFFAVVTPTILYIGYLAVEGAFATGYGTMLGLLSSLIFVVHQLIISLPISILLRGRRQERLLYYFIGGAFGGLFGLAIISLVMSGGLIPVDWSLVAFAAGTGGTSTLLFGLYRLPIRAQSP